MSLNGDNNQQMRGIAKVVEMERACKASSLQDLMGKGNMIITVKPNQGEAYQGIVALDQPTLAQCFAHLLVVITV
jgi:molecular chaperone Hsp33